jgi:hypothetical protein
MAPRRDVLWRLPHTDATAAAFVANAEANMTAAIAAGSAAVAKFLGISETDDDDALLQLPNPRMSWSYWDDLQAAIAAGTHTEESLREDAAFLDSSNQEVTNCAKSNGNVAQAVLGAFGLSAGSSRVVPTVLLVACKREQRATQVVADGPDDCAALHAALTTLAELAWDVWLPLGLQAQRWGYGE